jgi:S1-C subfamily serine protease
MHVPDKSIILILNLEAQPDWIHPWQTFDQHRFHGTGFVITYNNKKYVITNEHCIAFSKSLTLMRRGSSIPFRGRVVIAVAECDLAVLDCDDERFWEGLEPLPIGGVPSRSSEVYAFGFPLEGTNISVTRGIVSRHVETNYTQYTRGVMIQIDAAINPGNSGGPALSKTGRVVGVVKAIIESPSSIGILIPTFLLNHVLNCIKTGFKTFSILPINTQPFHNEAMQEFFGSKEGILITGGNDPKLKNYDLLRTINDKTVRNDGSMKLLDMLDLIGIEVETDSEITSEDLDEIVGFRTAISLMPAGTTIKLGISRRGKSQTVSTKLQAAHVGPILFPDSPNYIVFMGMVFTDNSRPLQDAAANLKLPFPHEPGVVLTDLLPSEYVIDFPQPLALLHNVNGKRINSLKCLQSAITKYKKQKYLFFQFYNSNRIAIIKSADVVHNDEISDENGIRNSVRLIV